MPRRSSALALLALLAAAFVAATPAHATISHRAVWDVSIAGKQRVTWSFAGERPEQCTSYYGTSSESAKGSGTVSMSFATAKRRPLSAETYLNGGKLRFQSFSTGGWRLPATWSKKGSLSVATGKPCGSSDTDPEPLPKISDTSGCGTKKLKLRTSVSWSAGKLVVLGALDPTPFVACPGVFEQAIQADPDEPCTPKHWADGLEGTRLQELHTAASAAKFAARKAFTVDASHDYDCGFPSTWPGNPSLRVDLFTSYHVTFTPRRR